MTTKEEHNKDQEENPPTSYIVRIGKVGTITRCTDGTVEVKTIQLPLDWGRTVWQVADIIKRNNPGDEARAVAMLRSDFVDVYVYHEVEIAHDE